MKPGAALVTGGAKRLGRAMALTLAEDGWDVAITWLGSEEEAEDTAAAIRALGRKAALIRADLTIEEETDRVIPAAMEALGQPLTCLINNASIFEFDEISSMTRRGWDRAMESNLRAPVRLTQLFAEAAPEPETDERESPSPPPWLSTCWISACESRRRCSCPIPSPRWGYGPSRRQRHRGWPPVFA